MVVIVEDDEIAGRLLVKMLDEFFPNENYVWLKSISETVSFFSMNKLTESDLLLLDFYLTDGTAWEILEKIRINELVFTGRIALVPGLQPNEEDKKLIDKFNPYKVIVKPIRINDLKELLN